MSFATQQIELSMCSPQTGLPLTANVYTIEGVTDDGAPRLMSIGQLVMAICLQRASNLEDQIIGVMETINSNSLLLETLTSIEETLVAVGTTRSTQTTRSTTTGSRSRIARSSPAKATRTYRGCLRGRGRTTRCSR